MTTCGLLTKTFALDRRHFKHTCDFSDNDILFELVAEFSVFLGTGCAPFNSFIQERAVLSTGGTFNFT